MRAPITSLQGKTYDVVVIGGGINGSSAAQHLAAAGYTVLLVDKGDFASGSTSRSSRLLHCGLRYLAPGRSLMDFVRHPKRLAIALRMARLAMQARAELVETSPARTRAMNFAFPIYKGGLYRGWHLDAAFAVLKRLGPANPPLDYRRVSAERAKELPLIRWLGDHYGSLEAVALFREYQMDWPERLCIDNVMDAERLGATVRNYTSARLLTRTGEAWTVGLSDMLVDSEEVTVTGKIVLNMGGIWIDQINREAAPAASRRILGTKGAHIVVKLPEECRDYGLAIINSKNEPFYCVPWRGYHYFGPTETLYEGDLDDIHTTPEDIGWLVREANLMLPGAGIKASDVVFTWSGVRPLTYDPMMPFGKRSRDIHDLAADGLPGVFAMTMGSVMNHRSGGRDMARIVAGRIPASGPARPSSYASHDSAPGTSRPREHAVTLYDAAFRRAGVGWEAGLAPEAQRAVLHQLMDDLSWEDSGRDDEIASFLAQAHHLHGPGWSAAPHTTIAAPKGEAEGLALS
ncbi:FAD-dependent oxidoreductase [Agaricicola taiwanensis]|uniref:FAD-dependent oxidoreductase n=1 Tax=Agaricicola taiwanensis TaxID=591372 RepID=A0A8J2YEB8_9RHOB|nr:FAD-dependent oxidoreductase [Agaricicola taiwanensis]GGE28053.1 FAD-dependent oxidoreductase [Agaricicola taiwanensis]